MNSNPEICIAFNGGAAGDFLVVLLSQTNKVDIDNNGMVLTHPSANFKTACKNFYLTKFKNFEYSNFNNIVNTHYCYKETVDLFPECKFYYIDDGNYLDVTTEIFIDKRITPSNETLFNFLLRTHSFKDIKKIKPLTDEHVKIIMRNDWQKCLNGWKALNLNRIDIKDIVDKKKCRSLVESMLQSNINQEQFNATYDTWASKNTKLISKIL